MKMNTDKDAVYQLEQNARDNRLKHGMSAEWNGIQNWIWTEHRGQERIHNGIQNKVNDKFHMEYRLD